VKYFNVIVSLIVAAAILVAAYSIGLLVRHGRGAADSSAPPAVAGPNEADAAPETAAMPRPGQGREGAPEGRTAEEIKQARAEALERMGNLTEEEKQEFRDRIRQRVGGRDRERLRKLTLEKQREIIQKLQDMSPEEREAFEARLREGRRVAPAASDANAPADANATEEAASDFEPNEPNQN
jgi:hypothetical protein